MHLDDEVEVALLVVVRGRGVRTHHHLAVHFRVQEHVLAGGKAQGVLGGWQREPKQPDVRAQLWVDGGGWWVVEGG